MMGISYGHIKDPEILSIITIVGLISIAFSSYGILYGNKIFQIIKKHKRILKYIPGKNKKEINNKNKEAHDIILFGYGRFGKELYDTLSRRAKKKILVIEENPNIINELSEENIPNMYGDA
ncbi:MAG: hypothetical protein GXP45_06005 [bacterium]|nr:hypothetical protein [bacterium]